ncbi:MAG: hypothetical protein JW982_04755 [Spirochaetes bacterium]|nr:hypothetical protein [Spirochaetota bacterium]
MISNFDELFHELSKSPDSKETFNYNFVDKKNKLYVFANIDFIPKNNELDFSWYVFLNNHEYHFNECISKDEKMNGSKLSSKGLKYGIDSKDREKFSLELKNNLFDVSCELKSFHHIYDYPKAVDMDVDEIRDKYESMLWKRFEQRCKIQGTLRHKSGELKGKAIPISCFGQRNREWGPRLWKNLIAVSTYYIQFREMSISLSYYDFEETVLSSGYISKKSGNIPIYETVLEHIDISREDKRAEGSEISYKDSQEDKDLIVSSRVHSFKTDDMKFGSKKFVNYFNISDFKIIGADKKGTGFERHYIQADKLNKFILDK